jgi:PPOX class probable F420-dependent enzyme
MSEPTLPAPSDLLTIDEATDFGARVAQHLREDVVVWLTTTSAAGAPAPNPVWFLWDGRSTVSVFSKPSAVKLRHLQTNSKISLNFAGDGTGGDIVVLSGLAAYDPGVPAADAQPEYLAKYSEHIDRINLTPAEFAEAYSQPITIKLTKLRGH